MSRVNKETEEVFFALLRAGLWHADNTEATDISCYGGIDWQSVYQLAQEQSVLGIVLAGLEYLNVRPPQGLLLQWIGEVQMIEQTNKAMNVFVALLVENMRKQDIYTLLVKGQGVAQCYERPLWRASGDVDFYLSDTNYEKAKRFFRPLVESFDPDTDTALHINMHYGEWVVEIHANQHCSISSRANKVLDEIHKDLFYNGNVRSWLNGRTQVFLPSPDNDILLVFTHYLNHFYKGGLGVRQICDWCRLLWTYRDKVDIQLLETRLKKMGLISVWKAFGAFAVDYLGMPAEAMPFYSSEAKWKSKANRIDIFIIKVGNFGHNRDAGYYGNKSKLTRKFFSFSRRCGDMLHHARIFPLETFQFFPQMVISGLIAVARGE